MRESNFVLRACVAPPACSSDPCVFYTKVIDRRGHEMNTNQVSGDVAGRFCTLFVFEMCFFEYSVSPKSKNLLKIFF